MSASIPPIRRGDPIKADWLNSVREAAIQGKQYPGGVVAPLAGSIVLADETQVFVCREVSPTPDADGFYDYVRLEYDGNGVARETEPLWVKLL